MSPLGEEKVSWGTGAALALSWRLAAEVGQVWELDLVMLPMQPRIFSCLLLQGVLQPLPCSPQAVSEQEAREGNTLLCGPSSLSLFFLPQT